MSQQRNRMSRLRSQSSEFRRSRSVTPVSEPRSYSRPSAARRALLLGLVADAEVRDPCESPEMRPPQTPTTLRRGQGITVTRTPGGTMNATGVVPVVQTPRGHIRRDIEVQPLPSPTSCVVKRVEAIPGGPVRRDVELQPLPSLTSCVVERVEAMDLTDDEADEVPDQVRRWVQGPGIFNPISLDAPSTSSAGVSCSDAPGEVSLHAQGTFIQPGSVANASLAEEVARRRNAGSDLDSDFDDEFDVVPLQTAASGIGREIPNDDEELEEPVSNILHSIETAMDEVVDRLLGDAAIFSWEEGFETFRGVPETFSGPTPGPLKSYDTPYDAFTDIWDKDIIERIVTETNRYAKQSIDKQKAEGTLKPSSRLHKWSDTNADEMIVLFAVFMYMGIDQRSSQVEYWKDLGCLTLPYFKEVMGYSRYILLNRFLHFVDNSDVSQDYLQNGATRLATKLAKLAPIITHLNEKFSSLYHLQREVSIDESLTLFKGRLSWIQAIRTKAARFGIKSFELCESSTGYLYKFQIYTGKQEGSTVAPGADLGGKSTKVVLELLKGLEHRGHLVTMDNFYNCPALSRYLKSMGFDNLGTLRVIRKNVPRDISKVPKNVPKGTIIARHSGDVSIVAWKDSKVVTMISTFHNAETYVGSKAGKPLTKPVCVRDYNHTMGGVDLKDQKLSMYLLERKRCVKWYMKMFKRMLNVSIHNAFVLYGGSLRRQGKLPMTHREFRYELAKSLVERHHSVHPEISRGVLSQTTRLRKDILHVPACLKGKSSRKRCVIHQRLGLDHFVQTTCKTCNVHMCFEDCWTEWHSLPELKGHDVRGRKRKRTVE